MGDVFVPAPLSVDERLQLITLGLEPENISNIDVLRPVLADGSRKPKVVWMTAPTGRCHIGYLIPLLKFADFLEAGCEVIVLLLDVYSFCDNVKYPMPQVLARLAYYINALTAALEAIGVPASQVRFVQESNHRFSKRWIQDQWRLCALAAQQDVRNAWGRSHNPNILSPMLCPLFQALAEEHLDADFQFGGLDQKGLFAFADRFLPQLGYRNRARMMNVMLRNLLGGTSKMSASLPPNSKIMLLDHPESLYHKVIDAPCNSNNATDNGLLGIVKLILVPLSVLRARDSVLPVSAALQRSRGPAVTRDAPVGTVFSVENGGKNVHFGSYEEIEAGIKDATLEPIVLKIAVANALNALLAPVRRTYASSEEWQAADEAGYPVDASK